MSWIDQRPDDAMAGAFEAFGPEPIETVDPALFREAMARLGAAVHVVTTAGPAGRTGFTATAVCSVSDQPPTLLVCLNRRSQITPVLRENGVFCVNTLGADAEEIADVFAGRSAAFMEDRFTVRRLDHAADRRAGTALGGGLVRLPHRRGQGGRDPQRVLRRRPGDPDRRFRAGAGLSRTRLQRGVISRSGAAGGAFGARPPGLSSRHVDARAAAVSSLRRSAGRSGVRLHPHRNDRLALVGA